jgi:hypothetical protein
MTWRSLILIRLALTGLASGKASISMRVDTLFSQRSKFMIFKFQIERSSPIPLVKMPISLTIPVQETGNFLTVKKQNHVIPFIQAEGDSVKCKSWDIPRFKTL